MIGATISYAIYTVWLEDRPSVSSLTLFTAGGGGAGDLDPADPQSGGDRRHLLADAEGLAHHAPRRDLPLVPRPGLLHPRRRTDRPSRASIFVNLIPVFSAAMAVAFSGEPFGWYQGVGLALVMAGSSSPNAPARARSKIGWREARATP